MRSATACNSSLLILYLWRKAASNSSSEMLTSRRSRRAPRPVLCVATWGSSSASDSSGAGPPMLSASAPGGTFNIEAAAAAATAALPAVFAKEPRRPCSSLPPLDAKSPRSAKPPASLLWCLVRFRRRDAAFCARSLRSSNGRTRTSKSSSSASSSRISAFCAGETRLRFWLGKSSTMKLAANGNSCALTSGAGTACIRLGANCSTRARAVGGNGSCESRAGMKSRNLPRALSAQASHIGMSSSLNSGGKVGKSAPKVGPPAVLMRSMSTWMRRQSFRKSGPNAISTSCCRSRALRASAMAPSLASSCFRIVPKV
mmetsp:Transcript_99968/g.280060  ORF Transcript_99968/g.280060 Transcript_99968/m.280060 type:complete len:315 (+) Transcript_99968:205-1149(+)